MKIQFDTLAKTIKVEGAVDMGELINALEKFLPNGAWREYKLETNTVIYWQQPYIFRWNEHQYWQSPITCYTGNTANSGKCGFNNSTTTYINNSPSTFTVEIN